MGYLLNLFNVEDPPTTSPSIPSRSSVIRSMHPYNIAYCLTFQQATLGISTRTMNTLSLLHPFTLTPLFTPAFSPRHSEQYSTHTFQTFMGGTLIQSPRPRLDLQPCNLGLASSRHGRSAANLSHTHLGARPIAPKPLSSYWIVRTLCTWLLLACVVPRVKPALSLPQ